MAPRKAKGGAPSTSGGEAQESGGMEAIVSRFPLTYPFPDPLTDLDVIPASDVSLEQDLLLNIDNQRSWNGYLDHVVSSNRPSENQPLFHSPDDALSSVEVRYLGPLASSENRLALKRVTFAYERAIAQFPTSYGIWRDYLLLRMQLVLAEPRGGLDGFWKRQIKTGKQNLEAGPTLLEGGAEGADEWEWGKRQGASIEALDGRVGHREWESLAAVFERSLICIPRAPRIWLLYFTLLLHPSCPPTLSHTHTRRTFDRALRTLAPSQHLRVWKLYLRWAEMRSGETCLRIWRRYLSVDPSLTERFVVLLERMRASLEEEEGDDDDEEEEEDEEKDKLKARRSLEAAKVLLKLASEAGQGRYTSPEGKSAYQLLIEWLELCEKYPDEVGMDREEEDALPSSSGESGSAAYKLTDSDTDVASSSRLPVSHIVRSLGLARFPDQAGRLWTGLATYWIRRNDLEAAKDTFEEGIANVVTVRDFTQIFDAYAETSENVVGFLMEALAGDEEDEDDEEEEAEEDESRAAKEAELDQKMKEFEDLMERRPFLVNDVLLRRNPNDVQEWEKRVLLHGDDDEKVVETYKKAIETINPRKATANHHVLFINFARFYEEGGNAGREFLQQLQGGDPVGEDEDVPEADLDSARKVYERATTVPFKRVDDLADVWCQWASMEARQGNFDAALRVMVRATAAPRSAAQIKSISFYDESLPVQTRLFKSAKLWAFYVDLQEALDSDGSVEGTKAVYDRMIDLKIATPQVLINYAGFLEDHHYFEEAFKVYERGVEAFTYPVAFELWNVYLSKFVARYGGTKIERARDLFEQALESCPEKFVRPLFLKYGQLEEEHGLSKRAMRIYERATERVSEDDRFDTFAFYIAKVAEGAGGIAATRSVYSRAIEVLPDRQTARMCLRFAALERKLGEVDRARAIYGHAAQFVDPRSDDEGSGAEGGLGFWKAWNRFEIECGTEETFREMLRIKRSVQAQFNTDVSYIAAYARSAAAKAKQQTNGSAAAAAAANEEVDDDEDQENDPMRKAEVEARARAGGPSFVTAKQSQAQVQQAPEENEEEIGGGDDDDEDLM